MSEQKVNVVFVDDEPKILDGLRRQLRDHHDRWDMRFATSAGTALKMLGETPADVIVSDMRMPVMTGGKLLEKVRDLYPQTTRISLSGQTDQADQLCELGCIHQYLQKPCDAEMLCASIDRTMSLAKLLSKPGLRAVANRVTALPPAPSTYRHLVDELEKDDASLSKVSAIIATDPALSAKIIQMVNSAFFGIPRKVVSPDAAVVFMGLNTIHAIVIAGRIFDLISNTSMEQAAITAMWKASVEIGESAAKFATKAGAGQSIINQSRLAGLLSCIGRVILLTATPEMFQVVSSRVSQTASTFLESEALIYGATQDQVSAYALGLWAFSDDLIEAVALQSRPSSLPIDRQNQVLTYLHQARSTRQPGAMGMDEAVPIDLDFLNRAGCESMNPESAGRAA